MYVTGSNDGHVFVCDARVSNNFKVLGHLGTNGSIVLFFVAVLSCRFSVLLLLKS